MLDTLAAVPAAWITLLGVLGLLVGSFLNVVIHRLPRMLEAEWAAQCAEFEDREPPPPCPETLVKPRSRCPNCQHTIAARDNIPVLSWLLLRGRCRHCRHGISFRYPLFELATGLLFALSAHLWGVSLATLGACVLIAMLIALTGIDFDTQLLPDDLTFPLLWLGLLFNLWNTFTPLPDAVIGAMAGYLSLWSVFWVFKWITGKEGMGYGDFKLLAALGAWLGWHQLPAIIFLSAAVGSVVGIGLIVLARHGRHVPIPFGPYLAGAGILVLFLGDTLTTVFPG